MEKYIKIPADKLTILKRNPQYLTPKQIEGLKNSIKKDGFLVPIVVTPIKKSKQYEIISGNHRFMAGQEIGLKEYPCVIIKNIDEQNKKRLAMNLNTIHGDPPANLIATFIADLDEQMLKEIYLDNDMLKEILDFDERLGKKLKDMQIIEEIDNESHPTNFDCICPKCGKRHAKKNK